MAELSEQNPYGLFIAGRFGRSSMRPQIKGQQMTASGHELTFAFDAVAPAADLRGSFARLSGRAKKAFIRRLKPFRRGYPLSGR